MSKDNSDNIPKHIGFILDGNRRWAKKHGLPTYEGHLAGYNALRDLILYSADRGIKFLSIYAFSTENWKRSKDEVSNLMGLALRVFKTDMREIVDHQIKVCILGSRETIPPKVLKAMEEVEEMSKDFTRTTVAICFNYGGQSEIVDAARACIKSGIEISEENLRQHLYEPSIPDIDMVVRTSGEQRLSNFMLWRVAYSELYFMNKLWPDMRSSDVDAIIREYNKRTRRFGGN